ncbi:response regulator [Protofrankia symbiont of Coriaria ruscifolia]|uniref:response regulator n=1 Tax=Protofrankia symbiont of Coriaria ruscifolia TaxID=1306542 RepID=UPI0010418676|nr:response regulator [Protofrankia symbiont of Coriaria ruscifolia]
MTTVTGEPVRTLVVEDDPIIADAHRSYVERLPGFVVAGVATSGRHALRLAGLGNVDLVLLDFVLPDIGGLDICRALRGGGAPMDIIAVTSARDLPTVRSAVAYGVVQYIVKPFTFAAFRDRLERYAAYRMQVTADADLDLLGQRDVDRALATLRSAELDTVQQPKGLSTDTLDAVVSCLRKADAQPGTADMRTADVATAVGISRVTARRYLERLADQRLATRSSRYGSSGRPEYLYRWTGS